ncbi:MAG: asparagine synthase (glutamine-hydrolyzing) [Alphaproteobacteria bacterium]
MCGITGFSLRQGMANKATLASMATALAHRGPDGHGTFTFLNMALAHRRLSIIDVNGGHQPLEVKGAKAPVAAVVNGEIYNYRQLQFELRANNIPLATESDCEPVLHLVMHHEGAAFRKLHGMYAAAVADGRTGDMWLGVDPFGIKPLYYVESDKGFAFASEPRALLAGGWAAPTLNSDALNGLLNQHYTTGQHPLLAGIHRMLPGERLRVREGKIVERWRQLPQLAPAAATPTTMDDAVKQFEDHFIPAVQRHLQSDVPYGVLLSGGLDSTAVVVAMAKLGVPIKAYTAKFEQAGDEDSAAAALATRVGATHTTVTYGEADFWSDLPHLATTMDDLTSDYSSLPLMKLMARAKYDVKILLSGEGGDELLAGYRGYRDNPIKTWLKSFRKGDATPYASLFTDKTITTHPTALPPPWPTQDFTRLQRRQSADIVGWLPHDLLLRLDRVSMAHGIEGRVPFLDDTFAAWAFRLPDALKVGTPDGATKPLGKLVVREWLARNGHRDMAYGKKKGFSVPVGQYLGHRTEYLANLWATNPLLQTMLKPKASKALLSNLAHPKAANLAFTLTLLALWQQAHGVKIS